jgi:tripartite-type tricarboxylate transporter receptor subunit TctC
MVRFNAMETSMKRRIVLARLTGFAAGVNSPWVLAQAKPIRLIVPFPAGGPTDIVARVVADPLSRVLGQAVFVDNKGGAGGSLGTAELARAAPDGLTFGIASVSTHGVNPAVYKNLPYDPIKDFSPVTELVKAPVTLVIHPSLPVNNMADFIKYLKSHPGKVTYGSPGEGTTSHMYSELFKSATNTFMLHIPYRGTGPAMVDLLSGQIQVYIDQVASSISHIKSGKLKSLAVSWSKRLDILPEVPTFSEVSLFANNNPSWFGILAPAKTPNSEVNRVQQAVAKVIQEPAIKDRFAQLGLFGSGSKPDEFAAIIQKEISTMSRVAKFAKISVG